MTASLSIGTKVISSLGSDKIKAASEIPKRELGKTGEEISLVSLGGESTVEQRDRREEAIEIINKALDEGINYIDTAPSYGNGGSEENIGEVMAHRREEVFLATKTHDRSYEGTKSLLEDSLNRLKTDYLDLYQLHNIRTTQDVNEALGENGAIRAMEELKEQGVINNIGITGHRDPEVLLQAIEEYDFDCILLSLNAADIHYQPFQDELLSRAKEKEMGIIAMKTLAQGRLVPDGGVESIEKALNYVWSFPVTTSIIGISTLEELREDIELAKSFSTLGEEEMLEIERSTAPYEEEGNFFKYHW